MLKKHLQRKAGLTPLVFVGEGGLAAQKPDPAEYFLRIKKIKAGKRPNKK